MNILDECVINHVYSSDGTLYYPCNKCDRAFKYKKSLESHKEKCHPEDFVERSYNKNHIEDSCIYISNNVSGQINKQNQIYYDEPATTSLVQVENFGTNKHAYNIMAAQNNKISSKKNLKSVIENIVDKKLKQAGLLRRNVEEEDNPEVLVQNVMESLNIDEYFLDGDESDEGLPEIIDIDETFVENNPDMELHDAERFEVVRVNPQLMNTHKNYSLKELHSISVTKKTNVSKTITQMSPISTRVLRSDLAKDKSENGVNLDGGTKISTIDITEDEDVMEIASRPISDSSSSSQSIAERIQKFNQSQRAINYLKTTQQESHMRFKNPVLQNHSLVNPRIRIGSKGQPTITYDITSFGPDLSVTRQEDAIAHLPHPKNNLVIKHQPKDSHKAIAKPNQNKEVANKAFEVILNDKNVIKLYGQPKLTIGPTGIPIITLENEENESSSESDDDVIILDNPSSSEVAPLVSGVCDSKGSAEKTPPLSIGKDIPIAQIQPRSKQLNRTTKKRTNYLSKLRKRDRNEEKSNADPPKSAIEHEVSTIGSNLLKLTIRQKSVTEKSKEDNPEELEIYRHFKKKTKKSKIKRLERHAFRILPRSRNPLLMKFKKINTMDPPEATSKLESSPKEAEENTQTVPINQVDVYEFNEIDSESITSRKPNKKLKNSTQKPILNGSSKNHPKSPAKSGKNLMQITKRKLSLRSSSKIESSTPEKSENKQISRDEQFKMALESLPRFETQNNKVEDKMAALSSPSSKSEDVLSKNVLETPQKLKETPQITPRRLLRGTDLAENKIPNREPKLQTQNISTKKPDELKIQEPKLQNTESNIGNIEIKELEKQNEKLRIQNKEPKLQNKEIKIQDKETKMQIKETKLQNKDTKLQNNEANNEIKIQNKESEQNVNSKLLGVEIQTSKSEMTNSENSEAKLQSMEKKAQNIKTRHQSMETTSKRIETRTQNKETKPLNLETNHLKELIIENAETKNKQVEVEKTQIIENKSRNPDTKQQNKEIKAQNYQNSELKSQYLDTGIQDSEATTQQKEIKQKPLENFRQNTKIHKNELKTQKDPQCIEENIPKMKNSDAVQNKDPKLQSLESKTKNSEMKIQNGLPNSHNIVSESRKTESKLENVEQNSKIESQELERSKQSMRKKQIEVKAQPKESENKQNSNIQKIDESDLRRNTRTRTRENLKTQNLESKSNDNMKETNKQNKKELQSGNTETKLQTSKRRKQNTDNESKKSLEEPDNTKTETHILNIEQGDVNNTKLQENNVEKVNSEKTDDNTEIKQCTEAVTNVYDFTEAEDAELCQKIVFTPKKSKETTGKTRTRKNFDQNIQNLAKKFILNHRRTTRSSNTQIQPRTPKKKTKNTSNQPCQIVVTAEVHYCSTDEPKKVVDSSETQKGPPAKNGDLSKEKKISTVRKWMPIDLDAITIDNSDTESNSNSKTKPKRKIKPRNKAPKSKDPKKSLPVQTEKEPNKKLKDNTDTKKNSKQPVGIKKRPPKKFADSTRVRSLRSDLKSLRSGSLKMIETVSSVLGRRRTPKKKEKVQIKVEIIPDEEVKCKEEIVDCLQEGSDSEISLNLSMPEPKLDSPIVLKTENPEFDDDIQKSKAPKRKLKDSKEISSELRALIDLSDVTDEDEDYVPTAHDKKRLKTDSGGKKPLKGLQSNRKRNNKSTKASSTVYKRKAKQVKEELPEDVSDDVAPLLRTELPNPVDSVVINNEHVCLKCGKVCKDFIEFEVHKKNHHIKILLEEDELKKYDQLFEKTRIKICPICKVPIPRRDSWKRHRRFHSNVMKHACSICGKTFTRNDIKMAHEKRHLVL